MKTYFPLSLLLSLLLLVACEEDFMTDRRITGSGKIESVTASVEDFSAINLEHVANVYVYTGKERKVVFTAYENILPYMEAQVIGDELILGFNRNISVNSDEEIRVEVYMPDIKEISLEGVGNFYLEGPPQYSLKVELDGVGNIEAFGLPVSSAEIDLNGNGNIEIDASEYLAVDIDGLGNVYFKGSPQLTVDINGLGEVIRK